jgi:oligopeptide transport system substrate-binding protein
LLSVLFLGVALLALACGGDDNGGGGGDPLSPDGGGGSGASAANADLRMAGADPITLDPAIAGDSGSATYIVEIFGGLVTLDRDLKIVPDLAENWTVSPDGLVYTFKIRQGAQFHNGKPVTANDFKYSLDRTAKLGQTTSATAEAYLGDIVGAKDVTRGRAESISGVKVIDARTLEITIDKPKAYFLAKLTYPTAFVVDQQQVESNPRNWTRDPNGTGPYKMAEWRLNERIILEANDKYHLGAPSVKRVLFALAGGSTLTQYENDELDVAPISVNDIERVLSPRDPLNKDYKSGKNLSVYYIGFNVAQPPFDDPKVRQAFAMAINRDQIVRVVLKDMLPVANSFMMPGLPGYNQNAKLPGFDPEGAKKLLAESKYKDASGLGQITLTEIGGGANAGITTQAIIEMCAPTSASRSRSPSQRPPASSMTSTAVACRCSTSAGSWTTRTRRTSSTCCSTAAAARTTRSTRIPSSTHSWSRRGRKLTAQSVFSSTSRRSRSSSRTCRGSRSTSARSTSSLNRRSRASIRCPSSYPCSAI